jgi:hypothetical protein
MNIGYQLDREEATRGDKCCQFLDLIKIRELHEFAIDCINMSGSEEKLEEANKVADVLVSLLKKKKLLTYSSQQSFIDVLLTSVFLHNLFYDKDDWRTLFDARKILEPIAKEKGITSQISDAIFQTVEAQLGDDSPLPLIKPPANSPTELFSYSIWFAKEYAPQV